MEKAFNIRVRGVNHQQEPALVWLVALLSLRENMVFKVSFQQPGRINVARVA